MSENLHIDEIKEQFIDVLAYSQDIENPKVNKLFTRWRRNKEHFIKAFGGKLIKEIPNVVFTLDEASKASRIDDFLCRLERRYKCYDLVNFISNNIDGFYRNEVVEETKYKGEVIPKGMKLVRAFKYFIPDKSILTDIQNDASRVIQEDKIEGTLCFSVHPLDFLSASENTHNWRSCHALDGEYRGGNLSYMVDETTFMCYLRSSNGYDYQLPNFPPNVKWNSKKWRVMLYLSLDGNMLMAGRQYPFSSSTGMKMVLDNLDEFLAKNDDRPPENDIRWSIWDYNPGKNHWSDWNDGYFNSAFIGGKAMSFERLYPVGRRLRPLSQFVKDAHGSLQFNDLLSSSCYVPMYSFLCNEYAVESSQGETTSKTKFYIGGEVPCLICEEHDIENTEKLACPDCIDKYFEDDHWYCECCDRDMYPDDEAFEVEGDYICENCYDLETESCYCCGQRYFIEHLNCREINGEIRYYCNECLEEMD